MIGIVRLWTISCWVMGGFLDRFSAFLHNKTPLQRIVAMRGFFGGLKRSISREFTDENNLIGTVSQVHTISQIPHIQPWVIISWFTFVAWAYCTKNEISEDLKSELRWASFYEYEKKARLMVIIFVSVMTKNIDNAI